MKKSVIAQISKPTDANLAKNDDTFINKTASFRLTNTLLKTILKNNASNPSSSDQTRKILPTDILKKNFGKKITKKDKTKLKKQVLLKSNFLYLTLTVLNFIN